MSLRNYVFNLLSADSVLNGLGFTTDTIYNTNDVDTPQARPFMVTRWGATSVGLDVVNERGLTVWVHDNPSDYTTIDTALKRVRTLLEPLVGVNTGETGSWVSQVEWTGDSDDLDDDVQRTITRNSSYNIVGSAA